jgi:hypothetical protein
MTDVGKKIVVSIVTDWCVTHPDPGSIGAYGGLSNNFSDADWTNWKRRLGRVCHSAVLAGQAAEEAMADSEAARGDTACER